MEISLVISFRRITARERGGKRRRSKRKREREEKKNLTYTRARGCGRVQRPAQYHPPSSSSFVSLSLSPYSVLTYHRPGLLLLLPPQQCMCICTCIRVSLLFLASLSPSSSSSSPRPSPRFFFVRAPPPLLQSKEEGERERETELEWNRGEGGRRLLCASTRASVPQVHWDSASERAEERDSLRVRAHACIFYTSAFF